MQENLLDTEDIFAKSIGNSPLNENIESLDKIAQVIAEFDESVRDCKQIDSVTNYSSTIVTDQSLIKEQNLLSNITQSSSEQADEQNLFIDDFEENLLQPEEDKCIDQQPSSSQVLKEISQSQIKNMNAPQNESKDAKKNENSFSVKDDVLGGIQLSYVDFSKKIYQQYKEQIIKEQNNQISINQPINTNSYIINNNNNNIKNQPKSCIQQQTQAEDERQICLEKGIVKIKELGDTIKNSISIMHQKFNEVKGCVSQIAEQDKHKDLWDNKLNDFYNKLFRQASKALFASNVTTNNSTPSKLVIQKPQSVYRFNTKSSVTKPLSSNINNLQIKKPGSVNKFSILNKPKSVSKFQMSAQEKANDENKTNGINTNLPQNQRQKSFTVQKFNLSKNNQTQQQANNNLGVLKNSKDIKKDSLKKPFTTPQSFLSNKRQSLGKENVNFFKK